MGTKPLFAPSKMLMFYILLIMVALWLIAVSSHYAQNHAGIIGRPQPDGTVATPV